MKPKSGTYGDVADTERLKQQLSMPGQPGPGGPPQQNTPQQAPGLPSGRSVPSSAPGTVPDLLMRPTQNPDTPASTPLERPAQPAQSPAGRQATRQALEALANNPDVSEASREWAKLVLKSFEQ